MGYEDRDYFRAKPRFELSRGVGPATLGLIITVVAGFISGLVVSDTIQYVGSLKTASVAEFWAASAVEGRQAWWARKLFVLTASDITPWVQGYSPGYWKAATSWLVAPGIFSAVLDTIFVYFAGKSLEEPLGRRRFLLLFIGACVAANLMAGFSDALIQPGRQQVVIMGCGPGVVACFVGLLWILPNQRSIGGWPLKRVMAVVIGVLLAINVMMALFAGGEIGVSPTQLLWGAAFGAVFMQALKNKGALPKVGVEAADEPWSKRGYLHTYDDEDPAAAKQRDRERKTLEKIEREAARQAEAAAAEKGQLDAILAKISASGITSLTRGEKKFLDSQSKRKKD
ncbi:MAG: rhomboid family intramembrane serine protease [Planctomycetes bacterium]|nr:rhomboid family intramembrane serine protease [Planctomycetota bacterium]